MLRKKKKIEPIIPTKPLPVIEQPIAPKPEVVQTIVQKPVKKTSPLVYVLGITIELFQGLFVWSHETAISAMSAQ